MDTSEALVSGETTATLGLPPAGNPPGGGGKQRLKIGRRVGRGAVRTKMKVGTYNVNGMNEVGKRREVIECFNESDLDVLGLQETHLIGEGSDGKDDKWEGLKGWACWSGMKEHEKGRKRMGVALLLSERMSENVIEYGCVNARLCWVLCKLGISKFVFVSAYAPVNVTSGKGKEEMRKFWSDLNECGKELQEKGKIIILGDMNAKVGNVSREKIVGQHGAEGVNENGDHLVELCAERNVFLANTFFQHKDIHKYTWKRGEGGGVEQKSLIDYIICEESIRSCVKDARVVRGVLDVSDHFLVIAVLHVQLKWIRKKGRDGREDRVDLKSLKEENVNKNYIQELEILNEKIGREMYGSDINKLWEDTCKGILEIVEKVCGRVKIGKGRKGDAWWNEEIKEGVKRKRTAWRKMLQKDVPDDERERRKRAYKILKNEVKRIVGKAKKERDEELGVKLSRDFVSNRKLYHREIRRIRGQQSSNCNRIKDENDRLLERKEEVLGRWRDYFKNLMNAGDDRNAEITCWGMNGGFGVSKKQVNITRNEVKKAIKKLKLGKAPGVDGIRSEMLKYGGEVMIDILWRVCKVAWEIGEVPVEWTMAVIVPLYKGKGSKEACMNFRGISLLSIPGKVYGRLIIERVKEITRGVIGGEQGAFMDGRGCVDQIHTVRLMIEKYICKRRKLYAAFIDLEKAYDRVDRKALWDVLRIYGVGGELLSAVRAFYVDSNACVRIDGVESESFEIGVGVRQGCVMSPWLFNIFMDGVMKEVKMRIRNEGAGLMKDGIEWKIPACLYADDAVLFAESEEELQRMVSAFDKVCERRKLKVNAKKSKVMVFERREYDMVDFGERYRVSVPGELNCSIVLQGRELEEVREFKYLGSVLSKDGTLEDEIRERTVQGRKAIGELSGVIRGRSMSVGVKKDLRNSIILPTLTYGSEVWKWNAAQQSQIRAVEMTYLRGALGRTRWDRMRNQDVYESFGMSEKAMGVNCGVVEWVKRSALRWYGHIRRMPEERLAKRVYQSEVRGEVGRGRPPVTWEKKIEEYMRERVAEGVRGIELAKEACNNRDLWRPFCRGHPPGWELPGGARRRR